MDTEMPGRTERDRPGATELTVLVYEPQHAEEFVELLVERNAPGRFIACSDETSVHGAIRNCHVVVSGPFPVAALDSARELLWIQSLWAGVDSWRTVDLPHGVRLTRMTEIHGPYIAEYVFAHLLSGSQRVAQFHDAQMARRWEPLATHRLHGPLGVAGWGEIGRHIGRVAAGFGLPVRAFSRSGHGVDPYGNPVFASSELHSFLAELQILVLALPGTPGTRGLIGRPELALLAPGAVVVNIGRGAVLDEDAVVEALRSGQLDRAILDTVAVEPLPPTSPLWDAPGCTVTPHVAGPTDLTAAADVVARNLRTFVGGGWPRPIVDLERGY